MSWKSASLFYRQLALVHRTGIALPQAVVMAGSVAGDRHGRRAPAWGQACTGGSDLASQLKAGDEPPLVVALIHAGEISGRVPEMSSMLADQYDHLLSLRSLIIARLIYPVILLHVALMMPSVPGVILGSEPAWHLLVGPVVVWLVVAGLLIGERFAHRSGLLSRILMAWPLRFFSIPLIVSNSCRVLRAGFTAGLLVPDALELASGACGNRVMAARLTQAGRQVRDGSLPDLASALVQCGFPAQAQSIIANGETVGKLEETLNQVALVSDDSFRTRSLYAAKVFTGTIYGIAMAFAVMAIFSMYSQVYGASMKEAQKDIDAN